MSVPEGEARGRSRGRGTHAPAVKLVLWRDGVEDVPRAWVEDLRLRWRILGAPAGVGLGVGQRSQEEEEGRELHGDKE